MLGSYPQATTISAGQKFSLTLIPTSVNRTYGMDYIAGFKPTAGSDLSITRGTSPKLTALLQDLGSPSPVDGPVYPTPT